ncbi:MAG: hypothetical protein RJA29_2090 [Pseudomonadota bacterium]|jgi:hypothetical protein
MDIEITTRVAGIPAVARVTYSHYTRPNYASWASPGDYYGGWTLDWEICDSRGRPAPWLERKLTDAERERIEAELIDQLEGAAA